MNIEEKIKEAAAEVLSDSFSKGELPPSYGDVDIYFKQGYLLGIKEAFRWCDPAEEEPISNPLILKIEDGGYCEYRVGWYLEHKYRGWGFYTYPEPDVDFLVTGVVGYRCINLEDL